MPLRIAIDIDDRLLDQAMRTSGAWSIRAVVEEGLRLLIERNDQGSMRLLIDPLMALREKQ